MNNTEDICLTKCLYKNIRSEILVMVYIIENIFSQPSVGSVLNISEVFFAYYPLE